MTTELTDHERKFLTHLWKCLKWFGESETMVLARNHAKRDPYQLARLPELLQAEINKHHAKRAPIPSTAN